MCQRKGLADYGLCGRKCQGHEERKQNHKECPGTDGQDQSCICLKITPAAMWRMFWRWSRLLAGNLATGESHCLEMTETWGRVQERFTSATGGMGSLDGQTDSKMSLLRVAGGKTAGWDGGSGVRNWQH